MRILKALIVSISLAACSYKQPVPKTLENSNLTAGQVQLTLKKNITTQDEVVEKFGAPNLVTENAAGHEVWTYQKHANNANANRNSSYATVLFFGGENQRAGFEQSSRTMTLIIKFKKINGVKRVIDFSSRYSSF